MRTTNPQTLWGIEMEIPGFVEEWEKAGKEGHPTNQDGWNRKGLISDQGMRKKAWYLMRDYYMKKRNNR